VLVQSSQFTLDEVEVVVATVDLEDVRSYRGAMISRGMQTMEAESYPRCFLEVALSHDKSVDVPTTPPTHVQYYMPEEEIRCLKITIHNAHDKIRSPSTDKVVEI
jgi:NAD+ synthase (glutamine-hydrolysing)